MKQKRIREAQGGVGSREGSKKEEEEEEEEEEDALDDQTDLLPRRPFQSQMSATLVRDRFSFILTSRILVAQHRDFFLIRTFLC